LVAELKWQGWRKVDSWAAQLTWRNWTRRGLGQDRTLTPPIPRAALPWFFIYGEQFCTC
jgi:hypothetical protein